MPLHVVPADAEDAVRTALLENRAYGSNPFAPILFPGGAVPGSSPDAAIAMRGSQLAKMLATDRTVRWLKVVDTEAPPVGSEGQDVVQGSAVAFAAWHHYASDTIRPPWLGGDWCNMEACEAVYVGMDMMQERIMGGKAYVYLAMLHTDPKYQGRGAGGMLLKAVLAEAEKLGLPAFLRSSEAGHRLYIKHGFKDEAIHKVDMSKWGLDAVHTTYAMIRDASLHEA